MNPFSEYLYKANCVLRYLTYIEEYAIKYLLYDVNKSSFIVVSNAFFYIDNPVTKRSI